MANEPPPTLSHLLLASGYIDKAGQQLQFTYCMDGKRDRRRQALCKRARTLWREIAALYHDAAGIVPTHGDLGEEEIAAASSSGKHRARRSVVVDVSPYGDVLVHDLGET